MSNNKLWKRVTAGALALMIVAGTAPAGMPWTELIGGNSLVASADETLYSVPVNQSNDYGTLSASLSESSCSYVLTATPKSGYEFVKITAWNYETKKLVECSNDAEFGDTEYEFELSDIKAYFRKTAVSISNATVSVNTADNTVSVTLDGNTVPESGYDVSYTGVGDGNTYNSSEFPIKAGTYKAKVTGKGDYEGEAESAEFTVAAQEEQPDASTARVKTFDELKVALENSDISTIVLDDDITDTENFVEITRNVTIDLNGKTLKVYYYDFVGLCTVTIKNGNLINTGGGGGIFSSSNGTNIPDITLKNLNLESASCGIRIFNSSGKVTLDNVYFKSYDGSVLADPYNNATVNGTLRDTPIDTFNVQEEPQTKTDLSTATVTVDTIKKTFTVTLGEGDSQVTVPRDEYNLNIEKKVGNDFVGIDLIGYPSEPGEYRVTAEAKDSSTDYTGKTSAVFTVITYNKVEAKDPTVNETGNIEYYEGSDNKLYTLNDDSETYTETTLEKVTLPKIAVTKVDKAEPTVNDTGMEAHYEATIDNEKKFYTATLPTNAVSGEADITTLKEGDILAPGTVIKSADVSYEVFFDGENAGEITSEISFTTTTESYTVVEEIFDRTNYLKSRGISNYFELKTYDLTYNEVDEQNLVIDKIKTTKVEAKDPTVNKTGNDEYYTATVNGDTKYYTLNDDSETYTETTLEKVTLPKIAVTKVDKAEPTVNDNGMEAHYEATIDNETKYYILEAADAPEGSLTGTCTIDNLKKGNIIAANTSLYPGLSSVKYDVYIDEEYCGSSFEGIPNYNYYKVPTAVVVDRLDGDKIYLNTYKEYKEVNEQELVIDKIETTKVDAVDPTCTTTGNIEYYTDPEDNIYVLEDGVYVASTLEAVTLAMLPYEHFEAVDATCEEDGKLEYWYDKFKNEYYLDENGEKEVTADQLVIKKLGHKYKAAWKWADDYSAATVTLKCLNDPTEEAVVLEAEITEERVESTCNKQGNITYTAKTTYDNTIYTYSKTVALPYGEHTYGEPSWQWFNENTAKATFTCTECGATKTVDAVVRSEKTAPTITESGKITYTASVTIGDKTYIDVRVTTLNKLPAAPEVTYTPGTNAVKLDWTAVNGAEKYAVCGFVNGRWQVIDNVTDTSYVLEGLTTGKQYKVAVIAMVDGEWAEDFSKAIVVTPKAAAAYPKVSSIDYNEKYHQFRLNWDAVDGAEKYGVAVFIANKWKIVTQDIPANTTSFTSPKLKAGQTYNMVVCAKVGGKWDTNDLNSRAFSVTVK